MNKFKYWVVHVTAYMLSQDHILLLGSDAAFLTPFSSSSKPFFQLFNKIRMSPFIYSCNSWSCWCSGSQWWQMTTRHQDLGTIYSLVRIRNHKVCMWTDIVLSVVTFTEESSPIPDKSRLPMKDLMSYICEQLHRLPSQVITCSEKYLMIHWFQWLEARSTSVAFEKFALWWTASSQSVVLRIWFGT